MEKGASYASSLLKAEASVDLKELGIGPLRIRQSANGAQLIELPGYSSDEKADVLAARLKEVLAEEVEVSRPEKKADLRLSGLSDAVTAKRLTTAVAKEVGCNPGQVLVQNLRMGQFGSGTAHVELSATAAKKLLQAGSISVGWSRVGVHLMLARPRHCYRCLGMGHVANTCGGGTDRSTAAAHCAVCAVTGRPAGHVMGGHGVQAPCHPREGSPKGEPNGVGRR